MGDRPTVWSGFRSWMRTMRVEATPSEAVAAQALRVSLPEFLLARPPAGILEEFLAQKVDVARLPGIIMAT